MKISDGMAVLEAILFACGDALDISKISAAAEMDSPTAEKLLLKLNERYEANESGIRLLKLGNSYQLVTCEKFAPNIKNALESKRQAPLSQAAMEVLAIIAYNQPVTKGFVEQVRGIDSSSVVNSLLERNLLEEHGRLELPGRPIAYRTTDNFLRCFKLSSLKDLPPLPNNSDQVNFDEIEELNRTAERESFSSYESEYDDADLKKTEENSYENISADNEQSYENENNSSFGTDEPEDFEIDMSDDDFDSIDETLKTINENISDLI